MSDATLADGEAPGPYDGFEAAGLCECGQPLADHPPLPRPPRLRSWMSTRSLDQVRRANALKTPAPPFTAVQRRRHAKQRALWVRG
ncbi:MAG: hypothetical protein L0227_00705 [Chloroflexi bacterium]|nr:hypothetical protein [Chloroflexota bacterium]